MREEEAERPESADLRASRRPEPCQRVMSAFVTQVDLAQPLAPIRPPKRYYALWCLVRFNRQPLGWMKCPRSHFGKQLEPDMLRTQIAEQLPAQVIDGFRKRSFEEPAKLHTPGISVVVCTREHPDVLERQLQSTTKLKYPDFELVVVDNAPRSDRTRRVCEKFPFVRYVLEPRPGLDYARNTGWEAATKEIVAYTDDDAAVDPYWLTALAQPYADPQVNCVTGCTFPLELECDAQLWFERYGGMQRGFTRKTYRPGTWNAYFPLGSGRFGAGVNLSIRRATLEKMGGFDPALDVGSLARGGGDLDIMARVLRDGGTLVYEPKAIVWHQHRKTMRALRKQMFDYGWGFAAYAAKHSNDLELGNQSVAMVRRWSKRWGLLRFRENLKLTIQRQQRFPIHLILLEFLGGVLGWRSYKRSVRKVHSDAIRRRRDADSAALGKVAA
jgi:O-antigen biosynthesis protein